MFKFNEGVLPSLMNNLFTVNSNTYNTRQCGKFYVPVSKSAAMYKTLRFKGVNLWNKYSAIFDTTTSIHVFKKKVKPYIMNLKI